MRLFKNINKTVALYFDCPFINYKAVLLHVY